MSGQRMRAVKIKTALVGGMSLRQVATRMDLSPERVRQIVAEHPDLHEQVVAARTARRDAARRAREDQQEGRSRSRPTANAGATTYTDEQLDAFFRAFLASTDSRTSYAFDEWRRSAGAPALQTFTDRFGPSWAALCARYDVEPTGKGQGRKATDPAVCMTALRRVQRRVGQPPTVKEYLQHRRPDEPGPKTCARAVGGGLWSGVIALLDSTPA